MYSPGIDDVLEIRLDRQVTGERGLIGNLDHCLMVRGQPRARVCARVVTDPAINEPCAEHITVASRQEPSVSYPCLGVVSHQAAIGRRDREAPEDGEPLRGRALISAFAPELLVTDYVHAVVAAIRPGLAEIIEGLRVIEAAKFVHPGQITHGASFPGAFQEKAKAVPAREIKLRPMRI